MSNKKSPFPSKKRLFEKEYFCHLVMSKKKQEKSGNKQEKYDLLQTFYWYTITYGSGVKIPEKQCYQINPFFPTLKMKSFCVITAVYIAISQIFFIINALKNPKYSGLNFLLTEESQFFCYCWSGILARTISYGSYFLAITDCNFGYFYQFIISF